MEYERHDGCTCNTAGSIPPCGYCSREDMPDWIEKANSQLRATIRNRDTNRYTGAGYLSLYRANVQRMVYTRCPLCGARGDVLSKDNGKYYCRACVSALTGIQEGGKRLYTHLMMFCDNCGQPHEANEGKRATVAAGFTWMCTRCGHTHAPLFSERQQLAKMGE